MKALHLPMSSVYYLNNDHCYMKKGILAGGNWIIDQVKVIDVYPGEEKLVSILQEYSSNGGAAYNVLKALARLGAGFPLAGIGLVGEDERGKQIIAECAQLNIDTAQLRKTAAALTSYTDVMSVQSTGKRTFFHQRGANALLSKNDFDFSARDGKIFHLGYLLLLDQLDIIGEDGMTGAAHVLKNAKENGYLTSADVVSENSSRFSDIIPSSLPYIDYLFINEFEAKMLTGIDTTHKSGRIDRAACYEAALSVINMGVRQWVIIHYPEGAIALSSEGKRLFQPSLQVPAEKIVGAVGAGDAFAAGVLMGLHEDDSMEYSLRLGICAAASSLSATTSSEGILPANDCLQLAVKYGYRNEQAATL
jgi:sugar/nucleoside kinase (ribokinase family)